MNRSVGGVSVPVVLYDGDRETIFKNIWIYTMMEFKFFTTILKQMIGINQQLEIVVYCVDTNDARFPLATRRKILVTESIFPAIARGEVSFYFMIILMKSRIEHSKQINSIESYNYQEDPYHDSRMVLLRQINAIDSYNYREIPEDKELKIKNPMEAYDYEKYHPQDLYMQSIIEQPRQNSSIEVYSYQQKPLDFYTDKRPPTYPKNKQPLEFQQQLPPPEKGAVRIRNNSQYDDLMRKRTEEENFKLSVENAHENWMKISNAGTSAAVANYEEVIVFCVECRNAMLNWTSAEFHWCTNDTVVPRTFQNTAGAIARPVKTRSEKAV